MTNTFETKKIEYQQKIQAQIDKISDELVYLNNKADRAQVDIQRELSLQIADMKAKKTVLEQELSHLKSATEHKWDDIKLSVDHAWQDLKLTMENVQSRLSK